MMNNHRAGDTVKVTVYRGKRRLDFNVVLGEAESEGRRTWAATCNRQGRSFGRRDNSQILPLTSPRH
ncbi:MAG TPA: hypothetical protein VF493_11965 [Terriglobales bacterium]